MKILYVVRYPKNGFYSIRQKIDGQIQGMKDAGCEVAYLSYDADSVYLNESGIEEKIGKSFLGTSKLYYHLFSYVDLYKYAEAVVKRMDVDVLYFRSAPLNGYAERLFKTASKKAKIVVEIPTYSREGKEKAQSVSRRIYNKYSQQLWKKCSKNVDLFALIGEKDDMYMNRPAININNAVTFDNVELKKSISPPDGRKHILALASMSTWHGYDRLIRGIFANGDYARNSFIVDMVGDGGDGSLEKWKDLTNELGIQENIRFHGEKTGKELDYFFDIASIGVSSLGFYRVGFTTGSVLKLREYMARGLPFVYAHEDPDIDSSMDWCMKIPNDASPVDMDQLGKFVSRVDQNVDISARMRAYAEANMSWEKQFRYIINTLQM